MEFLRVAPAGLPRWKKLLGMAFTGTHRGQNPFSLMHCKFMEWRGKGHKLKTAGKEE